MTIRTLFQTNYSSSNEQNLLHDLVAESIQIHGVDVYYIPRSSVANTAIDDLLNEDDTPLYANAHTLEMLVKDYDGFRGDGTFLSKFGLEIRDEITFSVAKNRFDTVVGIPSGRPRPFEGDLIYFPFNDKMFEIKFTEHEVVFYQLGDIQMYDLVCELFEYSGETFSTGVSVIDDMYTPFAIGANTSNQYLENVDPYADNAVIEQQANTIIDFSEQDPWSEGGSY